MNKTEQKKINEKCYENLDKMHAELFSVDENNNYRYKFHITTSKNRLYTCQAWIYETDNYIILRSFSPFIAFIDKRTHEFYDVLRLVYGYTSTSAQHIAKFRNLCRTRYNKEYRYYKV